MTTISSTNASAALAPATTCRVALVGNPNSGKSTLFNRLTGIRQRTGNYPGVTVERRLGTAHLNKHTTATFIDLPGTYSLAASSRDERVVVDVMTGAIPADRPDVIVCVVDATNVQRHLFLVSQLAETQLPMVVALNMMDAAERQGIGIDAGLLSRRLGVPVVPISAAHSWGLDQLKQAIVGVLDQKPIFHNVAWPAAIKDALEHLRKGLCPEGADRIGTVELQRVLFDPRSAMVDRLPWALGVNPADRIASAQQILRDAGLDPYSAEPLLRYGHLTNLLHGTITRGEVRRARGGESIDRLLTHRVWGLAIFGLLMYAVFWAIYTGAGPVMDVIDGAFGALGETVGAWLEGSPMLQSLVVDGVIAGVGGVIIFLPQIMILFFFVSLLEDTGYMARAAYLMDKLFAWCGLNGKSFVPLLSSFACAVPGIMGTRTIENPWARLTTILIAPLMSCSARLPVYVLLIGAVVEPRYGATIAAGVLLALHLVGLVIALPMALLFNRVMFKVKRSPFLMEMPPYRVPLLRDAAWRMCSRGVDFLRTAGSIILAMAIAIWVLSYFPRSDEAVAEARSEFVQQYAAANQLTADEVEGRIESDEALAGEIDAVVGRAHLEQSYLGRMGRTVQPVFEPAGFDWRITVGVLASFPAREVFVATLGITYNLGSDVSEEDDSLLATIRNAKNLDGSPTFTVPVAMAIAVFFALCMQCMATLGVIKKEAGWRWAGLTFAYMTVLAWVGAVATYQIGNWFMG